MKYLVFSMLCLAAVCNVQAHIVSRHLYCRDSSDCLEDHCCIVHGYIGYRLGICKRHEPEGHICSSATADFGFYGRKYWRYCPCQKDLYCDLEEPNKALVKATVSDIYNRCLSKKEVKIILEEEKEENKTDETTTKETNDSHQ